jgi:hypothetical protein
MERSATIQRIHDQLQRLTAAELAAVLEYVDRLGKHDQAQSVVEEMLLAEEALRRDWLRPEEADSPSPVTCARIDCSPPMSASSFARPER